MKHPFDLNNKQKSVLKKRRTFLQLISSFVPVVLFWSCKETDAKDSCSQYPSGSDEYLDCKNPQITTLALGEEGAGTDPITDMIGEDGTTTKALGEEGGTTEMAGEEGGDGVYTTNAIGVGEEGGDVTTLAIGEEGAGDEPLTNAAGDEEGQYASTMAINEEGGNFNLNTSRYNSGKSIILNTANKLGFTIINESTTISSIDASILKYQYNIKLSQNKEQIINFELKSLETFSDFEIKVHKAFSELLK